MIRVALKATLLALATTTVFALHSETVAAQLVSIDCPTIPPSSGATFASEVTIDTGSSALGAYTFAVTYDPAVVTVAMINGGTTLEFSSPPIANTTEFSSGRTRFLAFNSVSLTSPAGVVDVAKITFRVVGLPGASTPLALEIITLADTDGVRISADTNGCSVTVASATVLPTETVATATATNSPRPSETPTPTASPTPSPIDIPTATGSATPTAIASTCVNDCDGNRRVDPYELLAGMLIALGIEPLSECPTLDRTHNDSVTVDELLVGVDTARLGCEPGATPTTSASPEVNATATVPHSPTVPASETATDTSTRTTTTTATPTATGTPVQTSVVNHAPVLQHFGVYRTYPGYPIEMPITGTDPDGDRLDYAAENLPLGAELNASTGVLSWMPQESQLGPSFVAIRCTDDGVPPQSARGVLTFQVSPLDECTNATCDPVTGCQGALKPIGESCCGGAAEPRVVGPLVNCPDGRALFIGRNNQGFGRLQDCDRLQVINFLQAGASIRFHVEVRCVNLHQPVTVRARLETANRLVFDGEQAVILQRTEDGAARKLAVVFPVTAPSPFFDFEGTEAQLFVSLKDTDGVTVSTHLRLRLTFDVLDDLPEIVDVAPPQGWYPFGEARGYHWNDPCAAVSAGTRGS